jgi:hypothetical protein
MSVETEASYRKEDKMNFSTEEVLVILLDLLNAKEVFNEKEVDYLRGHLLKHTMSYDARNGLTKTIQELMRSVPFCLGNKKNLTIKELYDLMDRRDMAMMDMIRLLGHASGILVSWDELEGIR